MVLQRPRRWDDEPDPAAEAGGRPTTPFSVLTRFFGEREAPVDSRLAGPPRTWWCGSSAVLALLTAPGPVEILANRLAQAPRLGVNVLSGSPHPRVAAAGAGNASHSKRVAPVKDPDTGHRWRFRVVFDSHVYPMCTWRRPRVPANDFTPLPGHRAWPKGSLSQTMRPG